MIPDSREKGALPPLADTHSHLADPAFAGDLDQVLERALRVGVKAVLVMSEDEEEGERVLELCKGREDFLLPCLGLFPGKGGPDRAEALAARIREKREVLGAIGEVGLDFRIEGDPRGRKIQEEVLALFVALSRETGLPLSVHSRSAGKRTLDLLAAEGAGKVVMHAFDGKARYALEGVERGWFFSIPPSLVRSRQKEKLVRALPLEAILLESDAPVLGPVPGKRNEPALLEVTVQRIAEIKGVSPIRAAEAAWANAARLFGSRPGGPGPFTLRS